MRSVKKMLALALCLLMTISALSVQALAANANVTYSGNAGKFIFAPGSAYSLTDLFPDFKDVMPGDTLTQKITVNNHADNHVKVKIYLRALGATKKSDIAFLDQLHLTVRKAENTPMFDAAADELDGLAEWNCLGTLYSGGKVDLNVTLEVPTAMDDRFQRDYGALKWEFSVKELPISPNDPEPPKTGDDFMLWPLLLLCSAGGIAFASRELVRRRKREGAGS